MKQKVKELRVRIDGLAQLTKELDCSKYDPTREGHVQWHSLQVDKSIDALFLAKAWLGKVLKELGEDTPYANDGSRKTVEDIEPTADTKKEIKFPRPIDKPLGRKLSHIEKVDWLRQEISKIVNEADFLMTQKGRLYIFGCNINQHLSEARFHLGFELERVRENENN